MFHLVIREFHFFYFIMDAYTRDDLYFGPARVRDHCAMPDAVAHSVALDAPHARVLIDFPMCTHGPSPEEAKHEGWIVCIDAPNGKHFTRQDLRTAVAKQYVTLHTKELASRRNKMQASPALIKLHHDRLYALGGGVGVFGVYKYNLLDMVLVRVCVVEPGTCPLIEAEFAI